MQLDDAVVGQPREGRSAVGHDVPLGLARVGVRVAPARQPGRRVRGDLLLPEARPVDAVGVAERVDRPAGKVGEHGGRDAGEVADQVPLRDRGLVAAGGEEHLVEVGHGEVVAADRPPSLGAEGGQRLELLLRRPGDLTRRCHGGSGHVHLGLGGRSVAVPEGVRRPGDVVVGAPRLDRLRVLLRIPTGHGVLVVLVDEQPLLLAPPLPLRGPHEHEAPGELLALDVEVQIALRDGLGGIDPGFGAPPSPVPDDDVATAVLAGRDHALEVGVLDRVVLDLHRQPADARVERRSLGHGPADEDAVELEAQVVVQPAGPMALDHEPSTGRTVLPSPAPLPAAGLGRRGEVPLALVLGQRDVGSVVGRCLRRATSGAHPASVVCGGKDIGGSSTADSDRWRPIRHPRGPVPDPCGRIRRPPRLLPPASARRCGAGTPRPRSPPSPPGCGC